MAGDAKKTEERWFPSGKPENFRHEHLLRFLVQVCMSAAMLFIGYKLLTSTDESLKKLGAGLIGTVPGYWLK